MSCGSPRGREAHLRRCRGLDVSGVLLSRSQRPRKSDAGRQARSGPSDGRPRANAPRSGVPVQAPAVEAVRVQVVRVQVSRVATTFAAARAGCWRSAFRAGRGVATLGATCQVLEARVRRNEGPRSPRRGVSGAGGRVFRRNEGPRTLGATCQVLEAHVSAERGAATARGARQVLEARVSAERGAATRNAAVTGAAPSAIAAVSEASRWRAAEPSGSCSSRRDAR